MQECEVIPERTLGLVQQDYSGALDADSHLGGPIKERELTIEILEDLPEVRFHRRITEPVGCYNREVGVKIKHILEMNTGHQKPGPIL